MEMSTFSRQLEKLNKESSDDELLAVARQFASQPDISPAAIAQLAMNLARSGEILKIGGSLVADVASTGGPGSLSTLLGPLYLAMQGALVPKLGIPGRPAGGIDCLMQLPGYNGRMSSLEVAHALSTCGYAHFLPTDTLAPLDKRMFEIRQREGLQSAPALVIASLLAKKISVGLRRFTIDVRVFPGGNFGATWENAMENASMFRRTATELGLTAVTVLTDSRFLQQPFLGRAESLWALSEVVHDRARGSLSVHANRCKAMAFSCLPPSSIGSPKKTLAEILSKNIHVQGASMDAFEQLVIQTERAHTNMIYAENSGFFHADPTTLRSIMVETQIAAKKDDVEFPDPLGIKIISEQGEWVQRGECVATVRANSDVWSKVSTELNSTLGLMRPMPNAQGMEGIE